MERKKRMFKILKRLRNKSDSPKGVTFVGSEKPIMEIGTGTYLNGAEIYCWDKRMKITIGKYGSFADHLIILGGGEHDKDWVSSYPFIDRWGMKELYGLKKPRYKGNIVIVHDVWIGSNVLILSGVSIGNGAVIGAGSVVVNNIPPYAIAAGNPARVIRYRFTEEIIEKLEAIKWWDWEEEVIRQRIREFMCPKKFVEKYDGHSEITHE